MAKNWSKLLPNKKTASFFFAKTFCQIYSSKVNKETKIKK